MSADEIKKICDIYDWDGKGELDMYYFGDVMYAMGMNIMKSVCIKYGQTNDTGKKFVKFDEVIKLVGDEIPKQDVLNLLNELAPKEDEEGFIPYMPFWKSSVERNKSISQKNSLPQNFSAPPKDLSINYLSNS